MSRPSRRSLSRQLEAVKNKKAPSSLSAATPSPPSSQAAALFAQAWGLHQQAQLAPAQAIYEQVLALAPQHFDALHLSGLIAAQAGQNELAAERIGRALQVNPRSAVAYSNQGVVLKKLQQLDAALASYDQAIRLQPDYAEAHSNRGLTLQALGQLEAALASHDQALRFKPDWPDAHHNRGLALQALGQTEAALHSHEAAIRLKPDFAEAHINRAVALQKLNRLQEALAAYEHILRFVPQHAAAHYGRACVLQALGQWPAAVGAYEQALRLQPDYVEAMVNRGSLLQKLGHLDAALASCDQALRLQPDLAGAHSNRGLVLRDLGQLEAAMASCERALALQPDLSQAHNNRGLVLQDLGRLDAALASYDRAMACSPHDAEVRWNKSLALLLSGDLAAGFREYECRWQWAGFTSSPRHFSQPLWLGEMSLQGQTILLHAEQGLGDSIQFCRYAKQVAALGARVLLEVPEPLVALCQGLEGVAQVIEQGQALPDFDCHCPLMSLPLAFKTTTLEAIAATVSSAAGSYLPYLHADADRLAHWGSILGAKKQPRVGLVWSGSTVHLDDHKRSVGLGALLAQLPTSCEYISLQKEVRAGDQEALAASSIRHFGDEIRDFADTAALCELVDVVISVDTSVAHLAGALGRPTWVLLPRVPDWRWLLDREDSPWYPSVRLYRQSDSREWTSVLERVGRDLQSRLASAAQPASPEPVALATLNASDVAPLFAQGLALHQSGEFEAARVLYERVLQNQPNHFDALHLSGAVALQLKQPEKARALMEQAIAVNPNHASAHSNLGLALQELGQLEAALVSHDRAIAVRGDFADGHFNRGNVLQDLRRFEEAIASYDRALSLQEKVGFHNNRGNALKELGRFDEALVSYERAIALQTDFAEAHINRGLALQELGRLDEAVASYEQTLRIRPDYAEAHSNKGNALHSLGQSVAALASYEQALRLRPDYAKAWSNRGLVLAALQQPEAAVASYEQAIRCAPDFAEAHFSRGNALQELGRLEAAVASYDEAIRRKPDFADPYLNRGNALRRLNRLDAAVASYDTVIRLQPDGVKAHSNRGTALQELGQVEAALASYEQALRIDPEHIEAQWNKGVALLLAGRLAEGWPLYEKRWLSEVIKVPARHFSQPLWLGETSLQGQTILLHAEQGLGDSIQLGRYAKQAAALGARVLLEVQAPLVVLCQRLEGVAQVIEQGQALPDFDCHCPLMSLPLAFKTTLETIPIAASYLRVDADRLAHWAQVLGSKKGLRVGLVWSGNAVHPGDHNRSVGLALLLSQLPSHSSAALADSSPHSSADASVPIEYISLQKEVRAGDQEALAASSIRHFGNEIRDFADTAALCDLVDVVISVDTSVAHLAGALGRPTWVLLPHIPDWRWLLDREDSPWYPSMKLYRQGDDREWAPVLARVARDLQNSKFK